jgi:hypothetical protein
MRSNVLLRCIHDSFTSTPTHCCAPCPPGHPLCLPTLSTEFQRLPDRALSRPIRTVVPARASPPNRTPPPPAPRYLPYEQHAQQYAPITRPPPPAPVKAGDSASSSPTRQVPNVIDIAACASTAALGQLRITFYSFDSIAIRSIQSSFF